MDKPQLKAKDAPDLGRFDWEDPFRLEDQLSEDERMLRDAARAYAAEKLQPRVIAAFRDEATEMWRIEGVKQVGAADEELATALLLAEALTGLLDRPWKLLAVGDGSARDEVRAAFAPLGERVVYAGMLDESELPPVYAACDHAFLSIGLIERGEFVPNRVFNLG